MSKTLLSGLGLALLAACGGSSGPVISSFTVTPTTVAAGAPVTFSWVVTGATSLTISPDVGTVSGTSATATPKATGTYTLTATSGSASSTRTVDLTVTPHINPAVIKSFTTSSAQVTAGTAVTLSWVVTDGISVSLDDGTGPKAQSGSTATVTPTANTTYTLSATGASGTTAPPPASLVVRISAVPTLTVTATPGTISQGDAVTLSWTGSARSFVLDDQSGTPKALGPLTTYTARPSQTTIYSVTGTSGAATVTKMVTVTVTPNPGTRLAYTDPAAGSAVVMLRLNGASGGSTLSLDLVTLQTVTASALALDLPLDSSKVVLASAAGNAGPGFQVNTSALDPGTSPVAAKAAIPTSGPLKDMLVVGIAQKPSGGGAVSGGVVDKPLPSGTVLATLTFTLANGAGKGTVFDGTGAKALLRAGTSTATGASSTFAIGTLVVQ